MLKFAGFKNLFVANNICLALFVAYTASLATSKFGITLFGALLAIWGGVFLKI